MKFRNECFFRNLFKIDLLMIVFVNIKLGVYYPDVSIVRQVHFLKLITNSE